jgi:hypothetical protein
MICPGSLSPSGHVPGFGVFSIGGHTIFFYDNVVRAVLPSLVKFFLKKMVTEKMKRISHSLLDMLI